MRRVFRMERQNAQRSTVIHMRRVCVHLGEILLEVMPLQNFLDEIRICVTHNLELAPEVTKS